jgi:hypothetical protein
MITNEQKREADSAIGRANALAIAERDRGLALDRARAEEQMNLTERPDESDQAAVIAEVFGNPTDIVQYEMLRSHPTFRDMLYQFAVLFANRPDSESEGTGYVTLAVAEQMRAALKRLAQTCSDQMSRSPLALMRYQCESEFRQLEALSRQQRTVVTTPQEQVTKAFPVLKDHLGFSLVEIEKLKDKLQWAQNDGQKGLLEIVNRRVLIDGEPITGRE